MEIITKLRDISKKGFTDSPPWFESKTGYSNTQIEAFENLKGITLPIDYKEILINFGSGEISTDLNNLNFLSLDEMINEIPPDPLPEDMQTILIFALDNSGNYYFFDVNDISKCGHFSVLIVNPGYLGFDGAKCLGKNITEIIENIMAGEDFSKYPYLE